MRETVVVENTSDDRQALQAHSKEELIEEVLKLRSKVNTLESQLGEMLVGSAKK